MDIALSKLLSHVYELEGLLLVADRHGSDTPAVVFERIREHASMLHQMAQLIPNEPSAMHNAQCEMHNPEPEPVHEPEPILEPVPEAEPIPEPEPAPEPVVMEEEEDTPPRTDDDELRPAFSFGFPNASVASEPEPDNDEMAEPAAQSLRVDEKLQRSMSKDLRKAFSVNDRFRFRRELFGNSEAEFVDAINMIESMHSFEEAQEYFLDDLGWDEEVAEVSEFMNIVRNHFS